jgi:glycosyltransferase involved in cell wall biosynthesis
MRILQVMAGGAHGGAEEAFVDTCITLHDAGIEQHIVTRRNDARLKRLREAGLPVTTLPFGGALDVYTMLALRCKIHSLRPDIVQSWMSRAAHFVPKAGPQDSYCHVARLGNYYKLKYFTSANAFVAVTPMIADYLIQNGHAPGRVRQINNFADLGDDDQAAPLSRADYATPEGAPLLLALARLHDNKGLDVLLRALVDVPDAWLWIAGDGPKRDELEALAAELGVMDRVRFLGWRDDRSALLKTADICVLPSRDEPFGTTFVQAWAYQTPLIASTADGPRQFVTHEHDGLLVPIDDPNALAQAIDRLGGDPGLQDQLIDNGYAHYQQAFTREQCINAYLAFYRDVLEGSDRAEDVA